MFRPVVRTYVLAGGGFRHVEGGLRGRLLMDMLMMTPGFCAGGTDLLGAGEGAGGGAGTPILFRKVFDQIDRFTCIQMLWVFCSLVQDLPISIMHLLGLLTELSFEKSINPNLNTLTEHQL